MNVRKNAVAAGMVLAVSMVCAGAAHEKAGGGIAAVDGSCGAGGICLDVTLAPADPGNPDLCGTETTLDAVVGEQVNLCYTVTNGSSVDLALQSLEDDVHGPIFDFAGPWTLSAGGSLQFNRIATVGESQSIVSTWSAFSEPPAFDATSGDLDPGTPDVCADRIFADGFDGEPVGCDSGTPGDFIDISASGKVLHLEDDQSVPATLPFAFDFYGHSSDRICIGNNGYLLFDTTECPSGVGVLYDNGALPSEEFPSAAILPFWDDLYTGGAVYTETLGVAPNRFYVVEWWEKNHFNDGDPPIDDPGGVTFEVVFGEDGSLAFNYLKTTFESDSSWDDGASATVGLQGRGGVFDEFSHDTASLHDQFFVDWTAVDIAQFTDTDAGVTINALAPLIDVQPAGLDGTAAAGTSTTVDLGVGNIGTSDLHWTLDEAAAATLHFPPGGPRIVTPLGDPALASSAPVPLALRRPHENKAGASASQPQAGFAVPVFAADLYNEQTETFDALVPGTTTVVAPIYGGEAFVGGALVDDDLTQMYAITSVFGHHPGRLFTINTLSGEATVVGDASNTLDEDYTGLAYDGVTRTLYASSAACGVASHLWTIDRNTGAPTLVGAINGADCITAIAIYPQGAMYGLDISADALFAIDRTTGNAAAIGSIGFDAHYAQDMAFDRSTGVLYYAAFNLETFSDEMRTVNLADGSTTLIGDIGATFGEVDAMAVETVGGTCATPADIPWLSVAPSGGTTVPSDSATVMVTLDASALGQGDYTANLCVFSDDRTQPVVSVPVSFAVTAGSGPTPPSLTKTFAPASILVGATSTLTITLINDNATDATLSADLVDAFPHDLVIAATPNEGTTCGNGTVTAVAGTGAVALVAGATIPANGSCTITVDVESTLAGDYANTIAANALQTDLGANATSADATLTVEDVIGPSPPTLTKAFAPASVAVDAPSTLTITLVNDNAAPADLTAVLTDSFPAGLVVSATPNASTSCGGAVTADPGSGSISLDSVASAIPANGACTISVDVQAAAPGDYLNSVGSGALQTSAGNNADPAEATLSVTAAPLPPTVTKAFTPTSVTTDTPSTLTITLTNDNATDATLSADLVDAFPPDLVVATANALTTCGNGNVTADAGGGDVTLAAGATIPANGSCTITVGVESSLAGDYTNTIGPDTLQTDLGNNPTSADATLNVVPVPPSPPAVSIAFSATSVATNLPSTLTLTLANTNATPATLFMPFSVNLPANLVVTGSINAPATDCGGALTALEADSTITLDNAGAAIPAHGACSITVDVVSASASVYAITVDAGTLQTSAGLNGPVSENLIVTGAFPDPYCAITFDSWVEPITYVEIVGAGFVNTSVNTVVAGGSAEQSEDYLTLAGPSFAPGGAYLMRLAGNTQGNFTDLFRVYFDWNHDGVFAADGSESADIGSVVDSTGEDGVDVTNFIIVPPNAKPGLTRMRVVKAWAMYGSACGSNDAGQSEDYLVTIDPGAVPPPTPAAVALAIAPDYLAAPGDSATVTVTLTNYNTDAPLALTSPMTDALPGLVIANPANASTTCASGVVNANPGDGMFTLDAGAEIPAGSTCTVRVDVTSATEGIYINTIGAGAVDTANGGNPNPVTATVQFASPTGIPTYSTDFEGFVAGDLNGQFDWAANGVTQPTIATAMPAGGLQHAALFSTSSTSTTKIPIAVSPVQPAGTSPYSSMSADLAISHTSNGAAWEAAPQDYSLGLATARVRFDKTAGHGIQVYDFVQDAYVDTGATWTQDMYFHLDIVVERATGTLDVCIDGTPIFHDASGASVAGENVTAASITQFLQSNTTASETIFVDNPVVDNAGTPSCGAAPSPVKSRGKRASDRRPHASAASSLMRALGG